MSEDNYKIKIDGISIEDYSTPNSRTVYKEEFKITIPTKNKRKPKNYIFNAKIGEVKEILIDNNYISKDKIRAKIKELEKRYENEKGALGLRYSESGFINGKINILKELLEVKDE